MKHAMPVIGPVNLTVLAVLYVVCGDQCLGQKYAMNHIMLFIALMATIVDWKRVQSPNMDDLDYVPTIVPKDGAMIHMKPLAWPNV